MVSIMFKKQSIIKGGHHISTPSFQGIFSYIWCISIQQSWNPNLHEGWAGQWSISPNIFKIVRRMILFQSDFLKMYYITILYCTYRTYSTWITKIHKAANISASKWRGAIRSVTCLLIKTTTWVRLTWVNSAGHHKDKLLTHLEWWHLQHEGAKTIASIWAILC